MSHKSFKGIAAGVSCCPNCNQFPRCGVLQIKQIRSHIFLHWLFGFPPKWLWKAPRTPSHLLLFNFSSNFPAQNTIFHIMMRRYGSEHLVECLTLTYSTLPHDWVLVTPWPGPWPNLMASTASSAVASCEHLWWECKKIQKTWDEEMHGGS